MNIVEIKNVTKFFGDYKASNDISLTIPKGIIHGLLGPNGAGKTTLIRMITNIYMPDQGEILVFGEKINRDHQNQIGYLPEERGLYKKMNVIDQLVYFGQLKGMSKKDAQAKAVFWLTRLEAKDFVNKKVQDLSKGMSQKVQFIAAVLHEPELMILDEPFSGFDPINSELFIEIILDLKKSGKTIILSTHQMHQVEQMCDEISLINKGKVILAGNVREIKKSFGKNNLNIEFEGNLSDVNIGSDLAIINKGEGQAELKITNPALKPNEIISILTDKLQLSKFEIVEPSINEIFIESVKNSQK